MTPIINSVMGEYIEVFNTILPAKMIGHRNINFNSLRIVFDNTVIAVIML